MNTIWRRWPYTQVRGLIQIQSRKDFFAKVSLASKEASETNYWLRLIKDAEIFDRQESKKLIEASEELIKVLTSIVKTGSDKRQDVPKKTQN